MILLADYIVGEELRVLYNHGIYIKDGIIQRVDRKEVLIEAFPDEMCIEYGQASILPGLIDMHVHLGYYYTQPDKEIFEDTPAMVTLFALNMAKEAFSKGVTTVRDVSSEKHICESLKRAQDKGYVTLPRIIHTDEGICMTGGHGHESGVREADGEVEIIKAIRENLKRGADWIKILTSHRESVSEYSLEELKVAVLECKRKNVKTAVHAGTQPSIEMAIQAGFDTIEHATFLTVAQAERMKEKGIFWVPTIYAYTYIYWELTENIENNQAFATLGDPNYFRPAYEAYKNNFKALADTGVEICAGTDMVLYDAPTFPVATELGLMVDYGLSPLKAIETATKNPARALGLDNIGVIKEGALADILVVSGNVAEDISLLEDILDVYKEGEKVF